MRHPAILLSFEYLKKGNLKDLARTVLGHNVCDILIDSGAFSAHRLGHHIRITSYIECCKELLAHPEVWGCIQLDKIGDEEGSRRNLDRMVQSGVKPMPVLTTDAPLERLKEYVQINKRICIAGGLGKFSGVEKWSYDRYRRAVKAHPDAEFHGLGYVRWPEMFETGLRTVDSSSHSAGERFGCLAYFDRSAQSVRKQGGVMNLRRHVLNADEPWSKLDPTLRWYLDGCGVTKMQWRDRQAMNVGPLSFASFSMTAAHVAQSMYAQKHGLTIFLASSNWNAWVRCTVCAKYQNDNGTFDYWRARERMDRLMRLQQSRRHAAALNLMQEVNNDYADRRA